MYFKVFGDSSKAIIFLHGWGADCNSFLWCDEFLPKDYLRIYVDFKGFGNSPEPSENYKLDDYVNDVKFVLDNYKIDELIIVGHSFGGRVAIKFAYLYGTLYNKLRLVLVDSAGLKPRRNFIYYFKIYRYKFLKLLSQKNAKYSKILSKYGSNDYKMLSFCMKKVFIRIVNEDLTCYLKLLNYETIIIWGDLDKETRPYMARKFHKYIKNSKLYFIKNAGHFCFVENPREFLIILDSFIRNK